MNKCIFTTQKENQKMIEDNCIPKVTKDLIEGEVVSCRYFLNPRGHQGVLVFFGDALDVFQSCKKDLSLREIRSAVPWAQTNPQRLEQIIVTLGRLEMINLGGAFSERLRMERQQNKKKRMMVWLQLTDACNLCCGYCYIRKRPAHMGLELAKRLVAKVVSDCKRAGFDEVVLN